MISSAAAVFRLFFLGPNFHSGVPYVLTMAATSAFALLNGHPWYIVPAVALPTSFWSNYMSSVAGRREYLVAGWWVVLTGLASLFLIEAAPFIWVFVIFGGFCFAFAGAALFAGRRDGAARG